MKYIILFTSRPETITQHRGQQLKPFVCTLCPRGMFSNFDRYKMHVRNHGKKGGQLYSRSSITSRYHGVHSSQYGRKIGLIGYKRIPNDQPSGNWSSVKNRFERIPTNEKYQCANVPLDQSISHLSTMTQREKILMKGKPHQCKYCVKTFSQKWHRNIHERVHTKEKPPRNRYQCAYCGKRFSKSCDKVIHERTHTKEKPYQCAYCEKSFSQSSSKTRHERIHTNETPYQCAVCGKRFFKSCDKVIHERTHTREKPYQCA